MGQIKNYMQRWFTGLFNDTVIPKSLQKNINRFYHMSLAIFGISILMMMLEKVILLNLTGIALAAGFIFAGIYMTQKYKMGRYEIIEGKCVDIEAGLVEGAVFGIFGFSQSRDKGGKSRKYIIERADGRILRIKERYKDDQIRVGKDLRVYIEINSLQDEQTTMYNYLGIDVIYDEIPTEKEEDNFVY